MCYKRLWLNNDKKPTGFDLGSIIDALSGLTSVKYNLIDKYDIKSFNDGL